jgi:hypothetical protein
MDEVRMIVNKQEVAEKDPGDVEQWRVLLLLLLLLLLFTLIFFNEILGHKVCRV